MKMLLMTITERYDFDTLHDRYNTASIKWDYRKNDAGDLVPIKKGDIPLWVAEMEFPNPPEIREALKRRIDHGFFGYSKAPQDLRDVIVERMKTQYDWDIEADWLVFNPGMVMFLGVAMRALTKAGDGVLMNTPVYGPFLSRPPQYGRFAQRVPLVRIDDDTNTFHYEIDFETFEASITPQTAMYFLCNPHNPLGKAFSREELQRLGEICLEHEIVIASDDIHCDLMLGDVRHTPIATLSDEIAQQTITMIAGTKTFNMAGIACSVAIIPNDDYRKSIEQLSVKSGYHVDVLAYEALLAGYRDCGNWLQQARQYMTANRDYLTDYIRDHLPMVKTTVPDGTYMSWLDFSGVALPEQYASATDFFVKEAGVIFSPGAFFGDDLNNYVRLNFAVPRHILEEAMEKVKGAIERLD